VIRARWKTVAFLLRYLRSRDFWSTFIDPRTRLRIGKFSRHNGDPLTYFFVSEKIPLDQLVTVHGGSLEKSINYKRVSEILSGAVQPDKDGNLRGRDFVRTSQLIEDRRNGVDDFWVCIKRVDARKFRLIDGATRAAILALTGETSVRAVITPSD